jgi:hypothetical protein
MAFEYAIGDAVFSSDLELSLEDLDRLASEGAQSVPPPVPPVEGPPLPATAAEPVSPGGLIQLPGQAPGALPPPPPAEPVQPAKPSAKPAAPDFRYKAPGIVDVFNSPAVQAAADRYGVPVEYLSKLLQHESGGKIRAKNPASTASGLGQFIEDTAREYGIDPFDPYQSVDATAKMLAKNYRRFKSWERAIGAHYGGPGAPWDVPVGPNGESPRSYTQKVLGQSLPSGGGENIPGASVPPPGAPAAPGGLDVGLGSSSPPPDFPVEETPDPLTDPELVGYPSPAPAPTEQPYVYQVGTATIQSDKELTPAEIEAALAGDTPERPRPGAQAGWAPTLTRIGSGLAAGAASMVPIAGQALGAGINAAGELGAQLIERGTLGPDGKPTREEINWPVVGLEAGLGLIPGAGMAKGAYLPAKEIIKKTALRQGGWAAGQSVVGDEARTVLETGRQASWGERALSLGLGGLFGGTVGGLTARGSTRKAARRASRGLGDAAAAATRTVADTQEEVRWLRDRIEKLYKAGPKGMPEGAYAKMSAARQKEIERLERRLKQISEQLADSPMTPPADQVSMFEPNAGDPSNPLRGDRPVGPQATPEAITDLYQKVLKTGVTKAIRDDFRREGVRAVQALLQTKAAGEGKRLYLQIAEAALSNDLNLDNIIRYGARTGQTPEQIFEAAHRNNGGWLTTMTDAGRTLAYASHLRKRFNKLLDMNPELKKQAEDLGWSRVVHSPWWEPVLNAIQTSDSFRSVMLVGQAATAIRNAITNSGTMMADLAVTGVKNLPKGVRHSAKEMKAQVFSSLGALTPGDSSRIDDLFRMHLGGDDALERGFKREGLRQQLGKVEDLTQIADRSRFGDTHVGPTLAKVEGAVTWLGRLSEDLFRRAVFQAEFDARLRKLGKPLDQVSPEEMDELIGRSTHKAMRETFANAPDSQRGKDLLQAWKQLGPATSVIQPFPRYWGNALKFVADYSPLGLAQLRSKKSRAAQLDWHGEGRLEEIVARSAVGTVMMGGSLALQASGVAGDKWFEVNLGQNEDGSTKVMDLRGMAGPFMAHLFLGKVAWNLTNGKGAFDKMSWEDQLQGLVAVQRTPSLITALADASRGDPETQLSSLQRVVGEYVGGFTVPLRTLKDVIAADGGTSEAKYYDVSAPLEIPGVGQTTALNPTIQNVPLLGEALNRPAARSITTGQERKADHPLLRQMTGAVITNRSRFESELKQIGLAENKLLPRTGLSRANRELTARTGALAKTIAPLILDDPTYQAENRHGKAQRIKSMYSDLRKMAAAHLARTDVPTATAVALRSKKLGGVNLRSKDARKSEAARQLAETMGFPNIDTGVELLMKLAEQEE